MDLELIRTATNDDEHADSGTQTTPVTQRRWDTQMAAAADAMSTRNHSNNDNPVRKLKGHRGPCDPSKLAQRGEDAQAASVVHRRCPERRSSRLCGTTQERYRKAHSPPGPLPRRRSVAVHAAPRSRASLSRPTCRRSRRSAREVTGVGSAGACLTAGAPSR
jgi:hypothetical protein